MDYFAHIIVSILHEDDLAAHVRSNGINPTTLSSQTYSIKRGKKTIMRIEGTQQHQIHSKYEP